MKFKVSKLFSILLISYLTPIQVDAQPPQRQLATLLGKNAEDATIKEVLSGISKNFAIPTYQSLQRATAHLLALAQKVKGKTTRQSDLNELGNAWQLARQRWELTESLNAFSPGGSDEFDPRIDSWPLDEVELKNRLKAKVFKIDEAYPETAMGMHAIEFLIFVEGAKKNLKPKQTRALYVLCTDLHERTSQLSMQFLKENEKFINSGIDGIKQVLSGVVEATGEVEGKKIGDALLGETAKKANPSEAESYYSKTTLRDVQSNVAGAVITYAYISPYIANIDADLDKKLERALSQSLAHLNYISWPIEEHLNDEVVRNDVAKSRVYLQEAAGLADDAFRLLTPEE